MNAERHTDNSQPTKGGPLPGLLRPPIVFLVAILLGIALNRAWPLPFQAKSSGLRPDESLTLNLVGFTFAERNDSNLP